MNVEKRKINKSSWFHKRNERSYSLRSIFCLLILIFTFSSSVYAWDNPFAEKISDDEVIRNANAEVSVSATRCVAAPNDGGFKSQIVNRYNKKFEGETYQCFEIDIIFESPYYPKRDGVVYDSRWSKKPEMVRIFNVEHGYIKRGNRWEKKTIKGIVYKYDSWVYKDKPDKKSYLGEAYLGKKGTDYQEIINKFESYNSKSDKKQQYRNFSLAKENVTKAKNPSLSCTYQATFVLSLEHKELITTANVYDKYCIRKIQVEIPGEYSPTTEEWTAYPTPPSGVNST